MKPENIEETTIKHVCIKCKEDLKTMYFAPLDPFLSSQESCFYCDNDKCKHFGILTLAYIKKEQK